MKKFLIGLLLVSAHFVFGAVPDNIAGYIYYTSTHLRNDGFEAAAIFAADGTFSGVYGRLFSAGAAPRLLDPASGTYLYTKLDDQTAQLTLNYTEGTSSRAQTLNFYSDFDAYIDGGVVYEYIHFARLDSPAPLVNCSNRSYVRAGGSAFAGFVIAGQSRQTVLVRAVGHGLSLFGLTDILQHPVLRVTRAKDNSVVVENRDWAAESALSINRAGALVGAFALPTGSKDAALITVLGPGVYICQVSSSEPNDAGEAMIEVYLLP